MEHRSYTAIAIAAILRGKEHNVAGQLVFIVLARWSVSLRSPWLADDPAGGALAQVILLLYSIYCLPATFRAYKFPSAMSFKTCISSDRSATSFFNLPFSVSSCLSFLA